MWVRRFDIERVGDCLKSPTTLGITPRSSSPASCGRRSCSAAGPSSGPRRRAPRPRWDKPS